MSRIFKKFIKEYRDRKESTDIIIDNIWHNINQSKVNVWIDANIKEEGIPLKPLYDKKIEQMILEDLNQPWIRDERLREHFITFINNVKSGEEEHIKMITKLKEVLTFVDDYMGSLKVEADKLDPTSKVNDIPHLKRFEKYCQYLDKHPSVARMTIQEQANLFIKSQSQIGAWSARRSKEIKSKKMSWKYDDEE